jgi:uncharacterized protein (DUF2235 family)
MKRLIVCCDGTWQKLTSEYPTNVVKITQAIKTVGDDGIAQLVYYNEGVGTGGWLDKFGGGAFGWGLDGAIQAAYRFLCLNYDPGDRIYLFGFSRGSYTVRSLAGLIYNVGLLDRRHIRKTPMAYAFYRNRDPDTRPSSTAAKEFRDRYSQEVDLHFLGCWDTVGALGVPDRIPIIPIDNWLNRKYQFHDTQINRRIQCARHAVAIDERRKVFYVTPMHKSVGADAQDLQQVWFPGDHGCVGGGTKAYRQLSDAALKWMMDEAAQQGLSLQLDPIENGLEIDPTIPFAKPAWIYTLLGIRVRQLNDDPTYAHPAPNSDPAKLPYVYATFDRLHESTKQRWCAIDTYRPEGLRVFATRLHDSCRS